MSVALVKGGNIALAAEAPGLQEARVGLGWSSVEDLRSPLDLDGVVLLVGEGGQVAGNYNLLMSHQVSGPPPDPNPRPGAPVGDAERFVVRLPDVPSDVAKIVFALAIYDAASRRQTFAQVRGAYIRVLNHANGVEVVRYNLAKGGPETAMVLGELYRHTTGWKFRAVGQGYSAGLRGVAVNYGVAV